MSKVIKQMEMDDLKQTFGNVRDMVVLTMAKVNALGDYTLRAALRKKQIRLKVVKNTLARKVFKELNFSIPDDSPYWQKLTMLAWGAGSIKELSKELRGELERSKNVALYRDKVTIKGSIVDGQPVAFKVGLEMPTRLELIGQIIGALLGSASAIAGCLSGPASQVASQIKQIAEKKEEETPAPPA